MLIADWEKVVLVWVNALKLADEDITDICQLHKSHFFLYLIECLGKPINEKVTLEASVIEEVKNLLKDEFKGYCVVDEPWDSYETTLVTSLLLLLSAFKCHDLRTPLYDLCGETQLVIQAFIQKFISIHNLSPLDQISRSLLISSLDELGSVPAEDDDGIDDETDDSQSHSLKRFPSPTKRTNSPELYRDTQAKIKSLKCKLDLVSWDKQHLLDEIEALKSDLFDLRTRYESKATQVLKLENELFLTKNSSFKLENEHSANRFSDPTTELNLLKSDFHALSVQLANCTSDLDQEHLKNAELYAKLRKAEEENISLTEKCAEYDIKLLALQANVDDLESVVSNLKTTVKDQADLLSDSIIIASPRPRDLSLNESAITGETMANVVEIKCMELENELENVKEALSSSENKCIELEFKLKDKEIEIDDLKSVVKERKTIESDKIDRLCLDLKEKTADVKDLREDNEFLTKSFEEKKKDFQLLLSEYNALKSKESRLLEELTKKRKDVEPCNCCRSRARNMDNVDGANVNADLVQEIAQMGQLLEGKQGRLEEANFQLEKVKKELLEKDGEKEDLLGENRSWKTKFNLVQSKLSDLIAGLKKIAGEESLNASPLILVNRIASQISSLNCQIEQLTNLSDKYENELAGRKQEVISQTRATQMANAESIDLRDQLRSAEADLENIRGQHRVRGTELLALQQAVSMCEHEKAILQRRIDLLSIEANKCENLKGEVSRLKSFVTNLEVELATEKLEHKRLKEQLDVNEKVNVAFDSKLSSLQADLKSQYDKELTRSLNEFNEKVNQYKRRMQRDKNHIKELSNELWETSDRYLLASQEADALRNQLRRTKAALQLVSNTPKTAPQNDESYLKSAPCLWTEEDSVEDYDETVTATRERRVRRSSGGGNSVWSEALSKLHLDDETFGDCFLEDLKAGIARLPQDSLVTRASCPPPLKANESSGCEKFANDKQSLLPPEKPKRKDQVAYCRPGPPTPSRNARLSLQSLDRVSHMRGEAPAREKSSSSHSNRLSRLFNSISSKTKSGSVNIQTAAASTKRKSFFRKFGANRENIPPPPWV